MSKETATNEAIHETLSTSMDKAYEMGIDYCIATLEKELYNMIGGESINAPFVKYMIKKLTQLKTVQSGI